MQLGIKASPRGLWSGRRAMQLVFAARQRE